MMNIYMSKVNDTQGGERARGKEERERERESKWRRLDLQ